MKRKIVLATVGSLGDLHPFMALGLALRDQGVAVTIASAAEYRDKVERCGLEFHAVRPSFEELERTLGVDRPGLVKAVAADNYYLFRKVVMPHLRAAYEDMRTVLRDADLALTSTLAFGARLAAEQFGVPWMGVVLQPFMFLSAHDPPVIPQAEWVSTLLRQVGPRPASWLLQLMKLATSGLMAPVQALRRDLGLPPDARHPLFEGQFSDLGAIGLYSPLLGEVKPDYPEPTTLVGFAPFDSEDGASDALDPALEAFLAAGPPPLVFTLGSTMVNSPGEFFGTSLEAAHRLGRRAVILVGQDAVALHAHRESPDVHVGAYAPYSQLFPRAAAVVHQGGIGTLSQALRAGRPQLVVPHFADQLDNARRACLLGAARSLAPRSYSAGRAAGELERLLTDSAHAARARALGEQLRLEDGARAGARVVMAALGRCAGRTGGAQAGRRIV